MSAPITTEHKRRLEAQGVGAPKKFPVLAITHDSLKPEGAFAEAQAVYLNPVQELVKELDALLTEKKIGICAHFYMGPELQGVLSSCKWPHIFVADSLAMADAAIEMAKAGVEAVVVLGVDFMSENVRAQMDFLGCEHVPVYRVRTEEIGCSLAESADQPAYGKYLLQAANQANSLHVVYINTGLLTKAKAHAVVPTITCTSSNVVKLVLQAYSQIPDLHVWFGPDTYMGGNLVAMFTALSTMDDAVIKQVHPAHDQSSMKKVLETFHAFQEGTCIVHHMFGEGVAKKIRKEYPDAYVTAHLEVPGEMFAVALEAQHAGRGVVGATSNILSFITEKAQQMIAAGKPATAQFILGTEAGMITPIVRKVQAMLAENHAKGGPEVQIDIVFPVASEAIAESEDADLKIVPGVAAGEGCSAGGGCATCPYMKMNSLEALVKLCRDIGTKEPEELAKLQPRKYTELVRGRAAAEVGGESIMHMRHYFREKELSEELIKDVQTRHTTSKPPASLPWVRNEGLDW
jgi:quinolinate synthase|eukprot:CAMPEP_0174294148 /NCGR_PEP_ID=MMETSP0809-20121228/40773_1 /TAXON_ID=73025 ORGANISM="Eutreptiella gymnastica-like, Strain CCMP1594" /NCGR_SAMPLE_ID=MMETSP0809 /ASSEMBLY_ACC=CAM_ASM_000658 /LENGTH=517 /DNA_ID=CAMNT_0015395403 /DNA_START=19 /DNA_END=1572 /DNA_ORIENTATION=+